MTASVESRRPQGTPNCGHDGDEAALVMRARPFHRQQDRAAPLAADADALDGAQHGEKDGAPDADRIVSRHESDGEGRQPHAQQRRDQGRFAADAIAVMAENRRADRARGKADEIGPEREQRSRQRILIGEVKLAEHQAGRRAIEEKVVPLDCRADRRCDHCLAQLRAVFSLGQCPHCRCHSHGAPPPVSSFRGASSTARFLQPRIYAEVGAWLQGKRLRTTPPGILMQCSADLGEAQLPSLRRDALTGSACSTPAR